MGEYDMSRWRERAIAGIRGGATFSFSRTFSAGDTEAFGDITRDYNPVHYDTRFAASRGFPGLICHGLLVGSMVCELGGQLAWLASGMSFRFRKPVYFGDTITCTMKITVGAGSRAHADAVFINQDGITVMTGTLSGYLPEGESRDALERMVREGDPTNKLSDRSVPQ
jgi:acyl dehydratase